ncbi:MAG: RagB/SusD family nutrient uptake outer membrane protein [Bacteroidota bacterium]|nr:RagB/SusD family nutrient uptake outer membrane protein [Bacteroidota bacterium]
MKNKIYYIIGIVFLTVALSGCSDFLDVADKGSASSAEFPSTADEASLMLTSSYAGSHTQGLYTFYWLPMGIYLYDHTSDTDGSYDSRATQMSNNTNTDCPYNTQTYSDVMRWIQLSNAALEGIEKVRAIHPADSVKLNYMKGQALFNRALAYWHGQIFFEIESKAGGLGLPLIDKVPKTIDDMMPQRATTKDSWNFIISTLNEAIPLLKGYNTDLTRATEWAAKGLLAKSYMQARYPKKAVPVLEDIINHSGKILVATSIYENMFYADEKNEFNKENLYEIDMTTNINQNGPWGGYTTGSGMPMVFAPWPLNLDFRDKASTTSYDIITNSTGGWGNNYVHDANVARFGFALPAPGNRIHNPNFVKSAARSITNIPWIIDPAYTAQSNDIRTNKKADPRLYVSAGQPYVDTFKDALGRETFYDRSPALNNMPQVLSWNHKKFTNRLGTESQLNFSSPANYPIIRLADIYLLYAEALKDSLPSKALEYVNKVHRRAYNYPVDSPSPVDYTSFTDATMAQAGDHLHNDVLKYERWAELFAEGQWWFDVRRWEIGKEEVAYYKATRSGTLVYNGIGYYVQPIPKTEIERYHGNLQQSEGY